jgi:hypothetical protein
MTRGIRGAAGATPPVGMIIVAMFVTHEWPG